MLTPWRSGGGAHVAPNHRARPPPRGSLPVGDHPLPWAPSLVQVGPPQGTSTFTYGPLRVDRHILATGS